MSFSSFDFIFVFLPAFLILYYLVPARLRSLVVAAGSAVFCAYGMLSAPFAMVILAGLTVLTYFTGIALSKEREGDSVLPGVILTVMFGILFFFKYNGFFLRTESFALPLGISFYVFSMGGYILDVHGKKTEAEHSFIRYCGCVLLFPKFLSGPIVPYRDVVNDMKVLESSESLLRFRNIDSGLRTFLYGLGLKVLLADRLSGLWNEASGIGYDSISVPMAWICVLAFSLRLYFDFWGYSLMAMGVGEMLGYRMPVNFNHPYAAKTMTDFWRRWHITLGAWFRDYIYIPLGGSRCSKGRMFLNMGAVWLATGLWHGSTVNFTGRGIVEEFLAPGQDHLLGEGKEIQRAVVQGIHLCIIKHQIGLSCRFLFCLAPWEQLCHLIAADESLMLFLSYHIPPCGASIHELFTAKKQHYPLSKAGRLCYNVSIAKRLWFRPCSVETTSSKHMDRAVIHRLPASEERYI